MSKTEIEINLSGSCKPPPKYLYVLFTLEHSAHTVEEICALAEKIGTDDKELYCIPITLPDPRPYVFPLLHMDGLPR